MGICPDFDWGKVNFFRSSWHNAVFESKDQSNAAEHCLCRGKDASASHNTSIV